jgi:hypothetical protein
MFDHRARGRHRRVLAPSSFNVYVMLPVFYASASAHRVRIDIQVVVGTAFVSLLFPFFWALFYFARPGQWRTPIFICVALSVFLTFWQAAVKTIIEVRLERPSLPCTFFSVIHS